MSTSMNEENAPQTNDDFAPSPPPGTIEPHWILEYPREALEREFYQQEGYWSQLLSTPDRSLMLDYIRQIAFNLAWQLYGEDSAALIPDELQKPVSLQVLLEYCSGTFKRLAQAVSFIAQSPNQKISRVREFTEFSLARGKSEKTLTWLSSHSNIQNFEQVSPEARVSPSLRRIFSKVTPAGEQVSFLPRDIPEFWPSVDYNTYENRFVRVFLDSMHQDLDIIAVLAKGQGEEEIRLKAETLKLQVRELLQYDFLKQASLLQHIRKPTVVMQKQPYYRRVYEIYRYYHRVFAFDWANPLFELPLRQAWLLYEYWCLFQVLAALGDIGFQPVKNKADFFYIDAEKKIFLDMPKGKASRLLLRRQADDLELAVYYNREFAEAEGTDPQEATFPHPVSPGVLLVSPEAAFVFDIKFKAYTSEGSWYDDLDRLHAYRDALRVEGQAVKAGWCLYPGPANLEKQPQNPVLSSEAPAASSDGVGLLRLRPGEESSYQALRTLLSRWLPPRQGYLSLFFESSTPSSAQAEEPGAIATPDDILHLFQPEQRAESQDEYALPGLGLEAQPSPSTETVQDEPLSKTQSLRGGDRLETQQQFQKRAREAVSALWGVHLRRSLVDIQGVSQAFGLVSRGGKKFVGVALQYSEEPCGSSPVGQAARLAACVWLLQNLDGVPHRFVVFGNARDDTSAASRWLENYAPLTQGLEFYFLDSKGSLLQWEKGTWNLAQANGM